MTEDQIERIAEREMDKLDRMFSKGIISREEYEAEVDELDAWCQDQHRQSRARQYWEW